LTGSNDGEEEEDCRCLKTNFGGVFSVEDSASDNDRRAANETATTKDNATQ